MDTTEEYAKRCSKSGELQALWRLYIESREAGDYVYTPPKPKSAELWMLQKWENFPEPICHTTSSYYFSELDPTSECIWLPRQDDLQVILTDRTEWELYCAFGRPTHTDLWGKAPHYFAGTTCWPDSNYWHDSPEKALLAFVMGGIHEKEWDGENWIPREIRRLEVR